jgi:site-specific recombinase XerD
MRTNQRLAQLWLDALATELGASAGTIATYTDDLNRYLTCLDENSLSLDEVGLEQIWDYIAGLDGRGYAGSTIARRITVARGSHKFLIAEELGSRDPTSPLAAMKRSRKLPFVLSIAETEALLETAHRLAADPSVGLYRQAGYARRAALFETLYASGMRISEALSLPADATPAGTRMLLVRGKGDKQRLVPLHEQVIEAIALWQRLAAPIPEERPPLGCSTRCAMAPRRSRARRLCWRSRKRPWRPCWRDPSGSHRTCCGMPLLPACIPAARTCACCRSCWDTPASRPPRSTLTSTPPASTTWSATSTP